MMVHILVSLGAILLSLYYILFWKNPHTQNLHLALVRLHNSLLLKDDILSHRCYCLARRGREAASYTQWCTALQPGNGTPPSQPGTGEAINLIWHLTRSNNFEVR